MGFSYLVSMRFIDVTETTPIKRRAFLRKRPRLRTFCRRHGIDLMFLHGSLAKDRHGPLSDVDLAISCPRISLDKQLRLQGKLQSLIGREDLDIAFLDRASSLLGMQVLQHGVPLYVRNKKTLCDFRYRTFRTYLDSQWLRRRFADYVIKAVT